MPPGDPITKYTLIFLDIMNGCQCYYYKCAYFYSANVFTFQACRYVHVLCVYHIFTESNHKNVHHLRMPHSIKLQLHKCMKSKVFHKMGLNFRQTVNSRVPPMAFLLFYAPHILPVININGT